VLSSDVWIELATALYLYRVVLTILALRRAYVARW